MIAFTDFYIFLQYFYTKERKNVFCFVCNTKARQTTIKDNKNYIFWFALTEKYRLEQNLVFSGNIGV